MATYLQYKQQYQWCKIPQEFQPSNDIRSADPYYRYWPSSLLIVKFWNISIIAHHVRMRPLFGIAAKIWSTLLSDNIITINHLFFSENNGAVSLSRLLIIIYFKIILLLALMISLYFLTSLSLYIQREQSLGNWYLYHHIFKENKDLATDIFACVNNIKYWLWLISQW